ncbi:MAG: hypothetical protein JWQ96_1020 [Segetibacter sp.]|nr:hypothetical protein [Segetibacter sp.]
MKKIFLTGLIAISLFACQQKDKKTTASTGTSAASDSANYTTIQWLDSIKNIGDLNVGQNAQIKFRFKNTGDKPLFIINAEPGCGCTVADFPKEAIAPGGEGEIVAGFDTKNQHGGEFRKNISVTTNTKYATGHILIFTGIIKKEGEEEHPLPTPVAVDTAAQASSPKRKVEKRVLNIQKLKAQ